MPNIEVIDAPWLDDRVYNRTPTEVAWVSPLDVHFSQNVIYPRFADGHNVDGTVNLIRATRFRTCKTIDGKGTVECLILDAPFPMIEAMYWAPKLRDGTGKPLLDENGDSRHGPNALFTVDNRRLYCMQRAAVAQYPQQCCMPVSIISDGIEVLRHIKKFRTRTNGLSINVSEWKGIGRDNARRFSTMRVWDWHSAVAQAGEGGKDGKDSRLLVQEAASTGSCGCWEYLDHRFERCGPFSNWQMRQWWERKMFPPDLLIRPYDAAASLSEKGSQGRPFLPVAKVFEGASTDFAPDFAPCATDAEASFTQCSHCGKKRLGGASFNGKWYCSNCWRRLESRVARETEGAWETAGSIATPCRASWSASSHPPRTGSLSGSIASQAPF